MKLKIIFLLLFTFSTFYELHAQPGFNETFNPFYICHTGFERNKYFFYGEIVKLERLEDVYVDSKWTLFKALVKVEKNFKGELPYEITLYIGYSANPSSYAVNNKYLFQAEDGKLDKQKVYFTENISRPMTDYSLSATEEVFSGIEEILDYKNNNFVEGSVFEYLISSRDVSLKAEEADRLAKDSRTSQPLADISLKVISEKDGKVYQAQTDAEGRFRIENVPPGTYKIKLELPEELERKEPFRMEINNSACSRKWYIPVWRKPQKQQAESGNL